MNIRRLTLFLMLAVLCIAGTEQVSAFYNPGTGRWLSKDPIGESGGYNLYSACRNNLIRSVDSNGLQEIIVEPTGPMAPLPFPAGGMDGPPIIGPSTNPIFQPQPPVAVMPPNPQPPSPQPPNPNPTKTPPDTGEFDGGLFRGMKRSILIFYPEVGENSRMLGVVPGKDVEVVNNQVSPKNSKGDYQGMSVAPSAGKLPIHRRNKEWGGTGKDPVWRIAENDILNSHDLDYHQDSPTHGVVHPRRCMPYDTYRRALEGTRTNWTEVSPGP